MMDETKVKSAKVVSRQRISTTTTQISASEFESSGSKKISVTKLGTYEALWSCASCGKKDNKGLEKICTQCGSPKEDRHNEIYYFDKEKSQKLSETQMSDAGITVDHNSDHDCNFCGATLRPDSKSCPICGGKVSMDKEVETVIPITETKGKKNILFAGIAIFLVIFLCGIGSILFGDRSVNSEVKSSTWTSSIDIEEYQLVTKEGWDLPNGSELLNEEEKLKETNQIEVGTTKEKICEDKQVISGYEKVCSTDSVTYDDGTSELIETCNSEPVYENREECHYEQVPQYEEQKVYDTWYTYKIWEWVITDTKTLQGHGEEVEYPNFDLSGDTVRKGDKNVEYQIYFITEDGSEYVYKTSSEEEFEKLDPGSNWEITVDEDTHEVTETPKRL
jgi:hypothetical protein